MNTGILKADIFFVITTVAVVLAIICIIIVSIYLVRILSDIKILSKKAKDEGEQILDDIRIIREDAEEKGVKVNNFFSFLSTFFTKKARNTKKRGIKNEKEV